MDQVVTFLSACIWLQSGVSKVFSALLGPTLPPAPASLRIAAPQRPLPSHQLQAISSTPQIRVRPTLQAASMSCTSTTLDDLTATDEPVVYNMGQDPGTGRHLVLLQAACLFANRLAQNSKQATSKNQRHIAFFYQPSQPAMWPLSTYRRLMSRFSIIDGP